MNSLYFAFKITNHVASMILLYFFRCFTQIFQGFLNRLCLIRPEETLNSDDFHAIGLVLLRYSNSGAVVPVTVQELTSLIKKRLPTVEYGGYLVKRVPENIDDEGLCSVCLMNIEEKEEVRELFNCCHVFHKDCLDSWVDVGRVTCPVCRSLLYPAEAEAKQVFDIFDVNQVL